MSTYLEKLQDVHWQKKRLDVLSRHDFTCQICGADDKTLHVHHFYYLGKTDPWNYPDDALWCVCKCCHKKINDEVLQLLKTLSKNPYETIPFESIYTLIHLHGFIDGRERYLDLCELLLGAPYLINNKKDMKRYIEITADYLNKIESLFKS
jgi:hypothetical protein